MISEKFQKIGWVKLFKQIFTVELLVLLLWIPCVIFIFKTIQDRKIAGLVAGAGFLLIPVFNIFLERKSLASSSSRLARVLASGAFFLLSAMPIFLFRVFNWEKSLEDISIFGILSGRELHSLSNILFIAMIVVYFVTNILDAKTSSKATS
ncbi:MAG: hypothetical protein V4654_04570 [Bdellovibrionota bacterium]